MATVNLTDPSNWDYIQYPSDWNWTGTEYEMLMETQVEFHPTAPIASNLTLIINWYPVNAAAWDDIHIWIRDGGTNRDMIWETCGGYNGTPQQTEIQVNTSVDLLVFGTGYGPFDIIVTSIVLTDGQDYFWTNHKGHQEIL